MKSRIIAVAIVFGVVFSGTLIFTDALAAEKLKWRMAILYPRGIAYEVVYHDFCEDVKRMSAGRLVIEEVYDGEGVAATEILGAVKSGLVEVGAPYMALHAGELPAGIVELGLPGGPSTLLELRTLTHEGGWKEELRKAYAKHNAYWIADWPCPATYLVTKKPIKSINDLKKLKIRCPGAYGKMMRNLGASPVTMAFSEVYTSLATGVIDGVDGCNIVDHRDGKFYEVAKYMYPLPLTGSQDACLIVNIDAWKKLPNDLQAILEIAACWHGENFARKSLMWERAALKEMMDKGLKMSPQPSETDVAKWKEAGRKVWPEYEAMGPHCKELIRIQAEFMKKLGL